MTNLNQTRGDTRSYFFQRVDASGAVITAQPDSLYFTVKKSFNDKNSILQKKLSDMTVDDDGTYHFTILPADTETQAYGQYVFDIQVTQNGVVTTICKGNFTLTPEATWAVNED